MQPLEDGFRQRVEALVTQIPMGRVMTYGQIAALCGSPLAARIVGGIAHFGDPELPWQRVVNKSGGLASGYPGGRAGHKAHLESEGIQVSDEYNIDVDTLLWSPTHDSNLMAPLIVIVGETASGKSVLAMELAQLFNAEIISADSWQVYRGFNIGTAKPSTREQEIVVHHLINIVDAPDGFNAALYKRLAKDVINDIHTRGKLPIMVGGTGLYIDSVLYDFGFLPTAGNTERAELNAQTLTNLLAKARHRHISLDGIDVRNKRRVIRALETGGQLPVSSALRPNTLVMGLKVERDDLRQRITERTNKMIAIGLEQEVDALRQKYDWGVEAMKGIGYREWQGYFSGQQTLDQTRQRIISASMGLAKRQRTWFKRNNGIQWVTGPEEAVDLATTFLNKKQ